MNMQFNCPKCGQIVETDDSYHGRTASCPFCANDIVIPNGPPLDGLSFSQLGGILVGHILAKMRKPRLAEAPWCVQFSSVYIIAFGVMFSIGDMFANGVFVTPFLSLLVMGAIGITLERFKVVRWLVVAFGAFNVLAWMFGPDGRYWPFHMSFIAIAVLLLLKPSGEWYRNGPGHDTIDNKTGFPRITAIATAMSFVAVIIIALGSNAKRRYYVRHSDRPSYQTPSANAVSHLNTTSERRQTQDEPSQYEQERRKRIEDEINYQNELRARRYLQQHNPQLLNDLDQLRIQRGR